MLGALKVLQGLMERILEPLDRLDILYVHGVCSKEGWWGRMEEGKIVNILEEHIIGAQWSFHVYK